MTATAPATTAAGTGAAVPARVTQDSSGNRRRASRRLKSLTSWPPRPRSLRPLRPWWVPCLPGSRRLVDVLARPDHGSLHGDRPARCPRGPDHRQPEQPSRRPAHGAGRWACGASQLLRGPAEPVRTRRFRSYRLGHRTVPVDPPGTAERRTARGRRSRPTADVTSSDRTHQADLKSPSAKQHRKPSRTPTKAGLPHPRSAAPRTEKPAAPAPSREHRSPAADPDHNFTTRGRTH